MALATTLSLAGSAITTQAAPTGSHCVVGLADFHLESPPADPFYVALEEDGNAIFTAKTRFEGDCQEENLDPWVDYRTENGTALAGSDYVGENGRLQLVDGGDFELVGLVDDVVMDEAVEYFDAVLTLAKEPWVLSPRRGHVYVIDDDGASPRAAFHPSPNFSQSETRQPVQIPVFLAGPISTPTVTVSWSVTGGTASSDDYLPPPSTTLTFTASDRIALIEFSIVDDPDAESSETLQIGLTDGADYDLGSPNDMVLTIVDNEESISPESKFHHPKNGWTYKRTDYRIREMHVFARDEGGAEVVKVEMALRKKKRDSSCSWWNDQSRAWEAGACSVQRWVTMSFLGPYTPTWPNLYEEDFPRLTPSSGTPVRYYTAWSRATDGAGNLEALPFEKGRNWNTFEVKRG